MSEKTAQNADFYQIIDFLTGCSINYSLLVDPDLIGPWLQQFWATASLQVINDVPHIRAKVAGKKILISEATIRADLLFDDENGVDCFPKQVIWDKQHRLRITLRDTTLDSIYVRSSLSMQAEEEQELLVLILGLQVIKDATRHTNSKGAAHTQSVAHSQHTCILHGNTTHHFFDDTADQDAAVTPDLERKSDGTEEVNIEEKEASNVKSGETEELDLETTQSTARQGTITPRTLNFEDEQGGVGGPSSPLRPISSYDFEETTKIAAEVLVASLLTRGLSIPVHTISTSKANSSTDTLAEWDAEEERKRFEELKKTKPKTTLRKPTSLAQERNQMMSFLKGQGYKNLQKLRTAETSDDDFWKIKKEWEIIRWRFHELQIDDKETRNMALKFEDETETSHHFDTSVPIYLTVINCEQAQLEERKTWLGGESKITSQLLNTTQELADFKKQRVESLMKDDNLARQMSQDFKVTEAQRKRQQEEFDKIQRAVAFTRGFKRDGSPMTRASSKKLKTGGDDVNLEVPSHGVPQEEAGATPSQNVSQEEVAAPSHSQDIPATQVEVPSNTASTAQHTASSLKKVGTRKKRLGRKGVHTSHSTIPIEDGDPEAEHKMCIKYASDADSASDDDTPVNFYDVVDWELLPTGLGSINDKKAAGIGLVLWGDLKVLMDSPEVNDGSDVWKNQQTWKIQSWKLYSYSGVHVLETVSGLVVHMFVDKKYPLSVNLIERMLDHQLEICHGTMGNELTTAVQLIAFLKKQISDSRRPKAIRLESIEVYPKTGWFSLGHSSLDCKVTSTERIGLGKDIINSVDGCDRCGGLHVAVKEYAFGFKVLLFNPLVLSKTDLSRNLKLTYVVPTGRVKVPAGRYVVPTGKDNVIVSTGRTKVIPTGSTNIVCLKIYLRAGPIVKEGQKGFYHMIRVDGSSNRYSLMIRMLQNISREDLETLWKLVKTKHGNTRPEDVNEKVFWGDLKVMFEPDIKSKIWRSLQGYKVTVWKLFDSSGVHFV
ncbi:hypothetical protein Tco_0256475 [Tanacetum coccineum]